MSTENKFYSLAQISDHAKKYDMRLAECLDQQGQKPCASHPMNVKPGTWIKNTLTPFTQRPQNNGIYYVYLYPDTKRKAKPDVFPIKVGKVSQNEQNSPIQPPQVIVNHNLSENKEDRLSLDKFFEYQAEINNLKNDNTRLSLQLEQANSRIKELENTETLGENNPEKGFLSDLLPIADQWINNQKEQRYFEMIRQANGNPHLLAQADRFMPLHMRQQQPGTQQAWNGLPKPGTQQTNLANDPIIKSAQEFIDNLSDEEYAKVEAVKKQSNDLTTMFDNLARLHPEIYEALYNHCYA